MASRESYDPQRGERFRRTFNLLVEKGYIKNQKDAAERIKTTQPNISSAYNGKDSVLTKRFIMRFAKAYPIVNPDYLIYGVGQPLSPTQKKTSAIEEKSTRMVQFISITQVKADGMLVPQTINTAYIASVSHSTRLEDSATINICYPDGSISSIDTWETYHDIAHLLNARSI